MDSPPQISEQSGDQAVIDRRVIDRCLAGNAGAWDELYERCHASLLVSIRSMLGYRKVDSNVVEEIAARVWFTALASDGALLAKFDPARGCRLGTYLARIARIEANTFFRSERRRRNREMKASRPDRQLQDNASSLGSLEVDEILSRLTNREREFVAFSLSPGGASTSISPANQWKLRSRIQSKLQNQIRQT